MKELIAHLIGDYVLQNHWEATKKTEATLPAVTHAVKYTAAFLPVITGLHRIEKALGDK